LHFGTQYCFSFDTKNTQTQSSTFHTKIGQLVEISIPIERNADRQASCLEQMNNTNQLALHLANEIMNYILDGYFK